MHTRSSNLVSLTMKQLVYVKTVLEVSIDGIDVWSCTWEETILCGPMAVRNSTSLISTTAGVHASLLAVLSLSGRQCVSLCLL